MNSDKYNDIIRLDKDETVEKTYKGVASNVSSLKKSIITFAIILSIVFFAFCVYLIHLQSSLSKYDIDEYWIVATSAVFLYVLGFIVCLCGVLIPFFINKNVKNAEASRIESVLTNRRLVVINTEKNVVIANILLSEVDDIKTYVDDQIKILTKSGKDYIVKLDNTADFNDRYPGLLRSERQRVRHLSDEA